MDCEKDFFVKNLRLNNKPIACHPCTGTKCRPKETSKKKEKIEDISLTGITAVGKSFKAKKAWGMLTEMEKFKSTDRSWKDTRRRQIIEPIWVQQARLLNESMEKPSRKY